MSKAARAEAKHFELVSSHSSRSGKLVNLPRQETLVELLDKVIGLKATIDDKVVGKVRDLLVHESSWVVRFLVVANQFGRRHEHAAIQTELVNPPDVEGRRLPIRLTEEQFAKLSDSENVRPLSEEAEAVVADVFGDVDPRRGGGPMATMHGVVPPRVLTWARDKQRQDANRQGHPDSPTLHSVRRMSSYLVETEDEKRYPLRGVLGDPNSWVLRYLVVYTKNWKPGSEVLVPMTWVRYVSWSESRIFVKAQTKDLKSGQRFSRRSHDYPASR